MLYVEQHPSVEASKLSVKKERYAALEEFLTVEIEDAFAARAMQEQLWRECLRMYEGVPKNPTRNVPIENAPNLEVTVGAIAVDSINAQALETIFSISPVLTARAVHQDKEAQDTAKAFQRWVNWGIGPWGIRNAAEQSFLDDGKLGTGIYYVPWIEWLRKTKSSRVMWRGPKVFSVVLEDFLVPGGSYDDFQLFPWTAMRMWLVPHELHARAKKQDWDVSGFVPTANIGWVRSQRELLGRTRSNRRISELYEVLGIYCYFDIDGDGEVEDLYVVWDRTSRSIAKIDYAPTDRRPFEAMRYQIREHLFYGIGIMEMLKPYEEEVTEIHNHRVTNMLLANSRFWKAGEGSGMSETESFWPSKVKLMTDPSQLEGVELADIYPTSAQAEQITMALAERRVGLSDMGNQGRPSHMLGNRTPGITALSYLQQVNRRFAPAFDAMRFATAGAVRQCIYRYREQILAGNTAAEAAISEVVGEEDAQRIVKTLRTEHFENSVEIELTASSASVNREADRQGWMMLAQFLTGYYEKTMQLVMIAANPQTPEPVRDVAKKIAEKSGELIDRTLRTFDQVRDPAALILKLDDELDQMQGLNPTGLQGLGQMMQQIASQPQEGAPQQ